MSVNIVLYVVSASGQCTARSLHVEVVFHNCNKCRIIDFSVSPSLQMRDLLYKNDKIFVLKRVVLQYCKFMVCHIKMTR